MSVAMEGDRMVVPKQMRSKLDLRWRIGVFLGTADRSNYAYIGTRSRNDVRSRELARVVEASKWDRDILLIVLGTPM